MKKQIFFYFFLVILLLFSFSAVTVSCASGSKNSDKETEALSGEQLISEETTPVPEIQLPEVKTQWFIYNKSPSNVVSGPFDSVNEALDSWLDNAKIKPKGKFYIGRNGVLITNNPKEYYSKKYEEAEIKYEKNKAREEARLKAEKEAALEEKEKQKAEKARLKAEEEAKKKEAKAARAQKKTSESEEAPSQEETPFQEEAPETTAEESSLEEPEKTEEYQGEIFIIPEQPETSEKTGTSPSRYQKTYLSDYIVKDIYIIPEEEPDAEPELEKDPFAKDSKGVTELMKACRNGNDWEIKALLKAGALINEKDNEGWTPLMYACRYQSNLSIVELLIENKAEVCYSNKFVSALVLASSYNSNPEVIKKLLEFYNPSDKEVQKAFIQLLTSSDFDSAALLSKAKIFLKFGLPVNSYYEGKTPLMYAASYCHSTKIIKLLLDNNATVNIRSTEGKTAFDYAQKNMSLPRDDIFWSLNER